MKLTQIGNKKLFKLEKHDCILFFSYETPIVYIKDGVININNNKYSNTTSAHTNQIKRMYPSYILAYLEEKDFKELIKIDF